MDMAFPAERTFFLLFPGDHKIGAAISAGPRIADKHFTDTRIFLNSRGVWRHNKNHLTSSTKSLNLDGPAIRNANRGDSRKLIRKFLVPRKRFAKKGGSVREPSGDSRQSG